MGVVGNFLFISFAFNFGLILYTLFLVLIYRFFLREKPEEKSDYVMDEIPASEATAEMEEIPIDV
jgi:hypothetical protein